jgi:uncharacterized membrane protein
MATTPWFLRGLAASFCIVGVSASAAAQTFTPLAALPGGSDCWPVTITPDAAVIVGTSTWSQCCEHAARWTTSGGVWQAQDLGVLQKGGYSCGMGVTADGSVVVGYSAWGDPNPTVQRAFRWTAATGIVQLHSPAVEQSVCTGITADGAMISGMFDYVASLWMLGPGGFEAFRLNVLSGDTGSSAWSVARTARWWSAKASTRPAARHAAGHSGAASRV